MKKPTPRKDAFERFCRYWNFGPWNASRVTVNNAKMAFEAGWNAAILAERPAGKSKP